MPKHLLPSTPINTVHPEFFAPNDATASPTGMSKVAQAFNYVSCVQKKVILIRAQNHLSPVSSGTTNTLWAHYFRTGENTDHVTVRMGWVGLTSGTGGLVTYNVREFSTGDATDALVGSASHQHDRTDSAGAVNPSQVVRRTFRIDGLSPNTEYHGSFSLAQSARILYATIHEGWTVMADDSVAGVCNPDKYHVEGPIYDVEAQDLTEACNELWQHNGAPYIGWAPDDADTNAPTTTSASFADLIANSAGFYIDATYHTTRNRTTVPVKMGVRCRASVAATAEFRLTDGTNNIDITGVTVPANARWFTTTATIPASTGTWRIQAKKTSGGTVEVSGWSLFPYEA